MKPSPLSWFRAGILLGIAACASTAPETALKTAPPLPAGSSLHGVFEGVTPCESLPRPLPQIPQDADCELMIWKIVFYQDSATGTPTSYLLESVYGVSQPNTTGPAGGGTEIKMEGNWTIVNGTGTDPAADVYQLHSNGSRVAVSLVKMSEDILHVLNEDRTLRVGNAAWSFTLNRTDNRNPPSTDERAGSGPESTRPPLPTMPAGSSVLGVYEGRLPCHDVVFDILKAAPFPGCMKLKSRLTLYVEEATGNPDGYMYMGTSTIRQGTWTIVENSAGDLDAVVYQLHLDDSQGSASFLKADENHLFLLDRDLKLLVGNALFSYTLSRIEPDSR